MRSHGIAGRGVSWLVAFMVCAVTAFAQTVAPLSVAPVAPVAPRPEAAQPSVSYHLLPKDTVHIKVFQEDDLETTARIDVDGNIFFPLLGKAKIGGQTIQEATTTIQQALLTYLVNPQVSVEIISYAKQHFTILGQVNKPGIFEFPDEGSLDLLEALGMAGGYTKIANPSKIIIKRIVNGEETILKVDGKKVLDPHNNTVAVPAILPGDTINVGEAIF
jgi:protein involved in polysaccharide export with SLBB domain